MYKRQEPSNPRSLLYQFEELQKHVQKLPEVSVGATHILSLAERANLEAVTQIKLSRLEHLLLSKTTKRECLCEFLEELNSLSYAISDAITDKYFDHRASGKQLVSTLWGDHH